MQGHAMLCEKFISTLGAIHNAGSVVYDSASSSDLVDRLQNRFTSRRNIIDYEDVLASQGFIRPEPFNNVFGAMFFRALTNEGGVYWRSLARTYRSH
jgi:hypothetical protein